MGLGRRAKRAKQRMFNNRNNIQRSPPPNLLSLPFCAGVQFSRDSIHAFGDRIKIRENRGLWTKLVYSLLPRYGYLNRVALSSAPLVSVFKIFDLLPSIFRRGHSFPVTWYGAVVWDTSPKLIELKGLEESRTGTRQLARFLQLYFFGVKPIC